MASRICRCLALCSSFFVLGSGPAAPLKALQDQAPNRRDVTVVAQETQFAPSHFEVSQDDLVRITLKSEKFPRTFAIDAYRISKRVAGGQSIVFEFRADQPGTFTFYCNLTSVDACKDMKGTLVVNPR